MVSLGANVKYQWGTLPPPYEDAQYDCNMRRDAGADRTDRESDLFCVASVSSRPHFPKIPFLRLLFLEYLRAVDFR